MEFHTKKSRFKELKCADQDHSLNRDFTVISYLFNFRVSFIVSLASGLPLPVPEIVFIGPRDVRCGCSVPPPGGVLGRPRGQIPAPLHVTRQILGLQRPPAVSAGELVLGVAVTGVHAIGSRVSRTALVERRPTNYLPVPGLVPLGRRTGRTGVNRRAETLLFAGLSRPLSVLATEN